MFITILIQSEANLRKQMKINGKVYGILIEQENNEEHENATCGEGNTTPFFYFRQLELELRM